MERSFGKEQLEKLFEETAEEQYTKTLLFSNVVELMSLVVCGMYPSVGAAYQAYKKVVGVSKVALYAKINRLDLLQIKFEQSLGSIHSCIKPQLNYTVTHNDDGDCGIVQPEF